MSGRQKRLCTEWAWLILPSTAKSTFGAAPASTGGIPAASRRVGPYKAHYSRDAQSRRLPNNSAKNYSGTLILDTTVEPSTTFRSVLVSGTTNPLSGKIHPIMDVRTYRHRGSIHHVTLNLGH